MNENKSGSHGPVAEFTSSLPRRDQAKSPRGEQCNGKKTWGGKRPNKDTLLLQAALQEEKGTKKAPVKEIKRRPPWKETKREGRSGKRGYQKALVLPERITASQRNNIKPWGVKKNKKVQ